MNHTLRTTFCLLAAFGLGLTADLQAARRGVEHQYGPTGIYGNHSNTEITVTRVDEGSPADGRIKPGMQIIGAGGAEFKAHVRRELADAIDLAETKEGAGKLTLLVKDGSKVDLTLEVLGSYSDTAPYNCPKTEAIIERALPHLEKVGPARLGLLHLAKMAIGGKEAAEKIGTGAWKEVGGNSIYCTWDWGYQGIAMSEYYLLTGDKKVLPLLEKLALSLARGQDGGGLWGHQLATPERNGRLPGYAQMNQPSLTCLLAMLLAEKCGISHPDLTKGINKSCAFYATFIGKGTLNYGVHGPNTKTFNNNGMSATAGLVMNLKGDKRGADFFSKLCAASYNGLETGHGGPSFNVMWTPLGVGLAGEEATSRFFKEARWLYTMYRSWDGKITFDGETAGSPNWSAGMVLPFCLGRRNLVITGRDADESLWLKSEEAAETVALGKIDYTNSSTQELIALFDCPIPQVTGRAVWALREKEQDSDFIPQLVTMIKEGTKTQKQSAIGYFGHGCAKDTALARLDDLGAILRDPKEDPEVRAAAAGSLAMLGEPAWKYYGEMVKLVGEDKPGDRFGDVDQSLGQSLNTLCNQPFRACLVTDKEAFYGAALKLANHKRQHARAEGLRMLAGMPLEDFHLVADTVMHVIEDKDPTYHSYHSPGGPVAAALAVLANLNIKEGIQLALDIQNNPSGKHSFKMLACWTVLSMYGANAKPALEELRASYNGRTNFGRHTAKYNAMIKTIEEDPTPRKLITFQEAVRAGKP